MSNPAEVSTWPEHKAAKTTEPLESRAITAGDKARALSPAFQRRVENALMAIEDAAQKGNIGVAYSSGKDSTVLLDLVRQVVPSVAVGFYDSGCEYPWTYEMCEHVGAQVIRPTHDLISMCRHGGYWGYKGEHDWNANYDFDKVLVREPAERFVKEHDLQVLAIGLRGQESYGRGMNARKSGALYHAKYDDLWHLCPLAHWDHDDIWAYIASRKLRYNEAYDHMASAGIPRDTWRVSCLLGFVGAATGGRFSFLRQIQPQRFNELAAEFPMLKEFA